MVRVIKIFLFFTLLASSAQNSQAYDDRFYRMSIEAFEKAVKPHIFSALSASDRQKLRKIDIRLVENVNLPTLAVTGTSPPRIYISLGFMDGLFQHIDCVLLENSLAGIHPDTCNRYFGYFFYGSIRPDLNYPKAIARLLFANHNETAEEWYKDPPIKNTREMVFMAALTSVIMHEYGHHIMGFAPASASISQKRRAEIRADQWSQETLKAIGEPPILGTMFAMGYLSRMEKYRADLAEAERDNPEFHQMISTHPTPASRVIWSYESFCGGVTHQTTREACEFIGSQIEDFD